MTLLRGQFGIGQGPAMSLIGVIGIGALVGSLSSGRIADSLIRRGHVSARMTDDRRGAAFLVAGVFLVPVLLTHTLAVAVGFAFLATIGLGGANPPLDAGRLDIMHSRRGAELKRCEPPHEPGSRRLRRFCSASCPPGRR